MSICALALCNDVFFVNRIAHRAKEKGLRVIWSGETIGTFCALCLEFWNVARKAGYLFTEEAPLAYAAHMLCGNPYEHTLKETSDLWASDWTGAYARRPPTDQPVPIQATPDWCHWVRLMTNVAPGIDFEAGLPASDLGWRFYRARSWDLP